MLCAWCSSREEISCADCKMVTLKLQNGSLCSIYSRSKQKWYNGKINKIFIDSNTNQEWLLVKYGSNKIKTIQRLCKDLRFPVKCIKSEPIIDNKQYNIWQKIETPPFLHNHSNIVIINQNEYVIATMITEYHGGIWKYNIMHNDWSLMIKYPTNLPFDKYSKKYLLSYDKQVNQLYLYGKHTDPTSLILVKIDLYSHIFELCVFLHPTRCYIGSDFDMESSFKSIRTNPNKFPNMNHWRCSVCLQNVKLSSILCHVCYTFREQRENIDINEFGVVGVMGEVNIKHRTKLHSAACCLCYKKYIIIFGGECADRIEGDEIFVLYLDTMRFFGCNLKCPFLQRNTKHEYMATVLPYFSVNLVYKFIKNDILNGNDMQIPMDMVNLICNFCKKEYVFLIQDAAGRRQQWRISCDDILNHTTII